MPMKPLVFFLCLFGTFYATAQDTLVFRNGSRAAVILKEITPIEIRYKKPELPDGPDYVIAKEVIERIIYHNGTVEVLTGAKPPVAETPVIYADPLPLNNEKVTYHDTKKAYRHIRTLALNHPDAKRQPELARLAMDIKQAKGIQDGMRTGAVVCGGLAIGGTFLYGLSLLSNHSEPLFYIPPAALSIAAVALASTAITFNVKLRQKRTEFVNRYND